MISSPLSCHSLEDRWRGGTGARGKRRTSRGEVKEQKPKTSRGAVVVLTPLAFIFSSLLIPPFLPEQVERHTAATKKSIIRLHLISPYFVCYFGG